MPKLVRVAPRDQVRPGTLLSVRAADDWIALTELGGEVLAFSDRCPHTGGVLSLGYLAGEVITCPLHAWRFNIRTGQTISPPLEIQLPTFPVFERGGDVFIAVPSARDQQIQVWRDRVARWLRRGRPPRRRAAD